MLNRTAHSMLLLLLSTATVLSCRGVPPDLPPGSFDRPVTPRIAAEDRPGTLRVQLLNASGLPVAGSQVIATSPGHPDQAADTDANGFVVFWQVHPGIWVVSASAAPGPASSRLNVEPEAVASVILHLPPVNNGSSEPKQAP